MSVYPMKKFPFFKLTLADAPVETRIVKIMAPRIFFIASSSSLSRILYVNFDNFHDDKKADNLKKHDSHDEYPTQRRGKHRAHKLWVRLIKYKTQHRGNHHHDHSLGVSRRSHRFDSLLNFDSFADSCHDRVERLRQVSAGLFQ